jgi:hypothetical protein
MEKSEIAAKIGEQVLRSTVKIHTSTKVHGAGLVISRTAGENRKIFFLVTNKHLVGNYALVDGQIHEFFDYISLSLNYADGSQQKADINLKNHGIENTSSVVIAHPEPYVDVAVVKIPDEAVYRNGQEAVSLESGCLADSAMIREWDIDTGDLVFTLGFLYNIYSQSADYPIAKSGYIASCIGGEKIIKFDFLDRNKNILSREIKAKVILFDGALAGGTSGGPIVTPRGRREMINTRTDTARMGNKAMPNLIIGIQSPSFIESGISVAFSSEYIIELINDIAHSS